MIKQIYNIGDIVECGFHGEGDVLVEIKGIKYEKFLYENAFSYFYIFKGRETDNWVWEGNINKIIMSKEEVYYKYHQYHNNIGKNMFLVKNDSGKVEKVTILDFNNAYGCYKDNTHYCFGIIPISPENYFNEKAQANKKAKRNILNKINILQNDIKSLK